MTVTYLISKWALIRRNELVDLPDKIEIHPDFLRDCSKEEFDSAFRQIHEMFYQIYTDMAESPEEFGIPLYGSEEYDYFSKEAREARTASWGVFYLLLCLFSCGEFEENAFVADTAAVRKINKTKKTNVVLKALCNYGFVITGIKNYSLASDAQIEIDYPDNRNVLHALSLVAKKVMNTQLANVSNYFSNEVAFSNGFIGWNYKVLQDDLQTYTLAQGCDYVADKMHCEADKEVVYAMDEVLRKKGFSVRRGDPNEGPAIRYYRSKSVYDFAFAYEGELVLELRIRNAQKCLAYVAECPDRIAEMFRYTDLGCQNRANGTCRYGVKYEFEGEEKWHCGCEGAPFKVKPVTEDIPHYLHLLGLGNQRTAD